MKIIARSQETGSDLWWRLGAAESPEYDPERRMRAIVANYTEDVIWSSPEQTTRGHEELNRGAQKLIDRTPDFVFTAAGPVHALRDLGYLAFTYGARP